MVSVGTTTSPTADAASLGNTGTTSAPTADEGGSAATTGPCSGTPFFCDDFSSPSLASAYTTYNGMWARATGSYTVTDANAWERAQSTLADDVSDFDLTFAGHTTGDYGFGLIYAAEATATTGYAVIVHPAQFQGLYLKRLVAGQADVTIASQPLSPNMAGQAMSVRVTRQGTTITVWLNGTQMLTASDGSSGASGALGLLLSDTDITSGGGAVFDLLRIDTATLEGDGGGSVGTPSDAGTVSPGDGGALPDSAPVSPAVDSGSSVSSDDAGAVVSGNFQPFGNIPGTWTLKFDDEFNGSALDTTKWSTMNGGNVNNVTTVASNIAVAGGNLVLTLSDANTGAGVCTGTWCGAGSGAYEMPVGGYAEARINFPGQGTAVWNWPAWWTCGANWPSGGESDIAEGVGTLTSNYHSPAGSEAGYISGTWANAYHVYGLYRGATSTEAYWDGQLIETHQTDDNGSGEWFVLNVGNGYGQAVFGTGSQVLVDYVRAWE